MFGFSKKKSPKKVELQFSQEFIELGTQKEPILLATKCKAVLKSEENSANKLIDWYAQMIDDLVKLKKGSPNDFQVSLDSVSAQILDICVPIESNLREVLIKYIAYVKSEAGLTVDSEENYAAVMNHLPLRDKSLDRNTRELYENFREVLYLIGSMLDSIRWIIKRAENKDFF